MNTNRRVFLRWLMIQLGVLLGGETLSACASKTPDLSSLVGQASQTPFQPQPRTPVPSSETQPTTPAETQSAASPEAPAPSPTANTPDLVVARGGSPETLVQQALAAIGGMERFVAPGDEVLVKPNICVGYRSYEYAATTNPWVVSEIVRLALEAGAGRVLVYDYPFGGTSEQAYITSGIQEQVLTAGGEMEPVSSFKFTPVEIPDPLDLAKCKVYQDVLEADVVINVPIAKHHGLARLTLGMKNLMGVIWDRPAMHRNLGDRLTDLNRLVRPALTVIDAVRILRANGPTGGRLGDVQQTDTLIVSPDVVAADSYAASLFSLQPSDLAYVRSGASIGLGRMDLEQLHIEEISVGA